MLATRRLLFLPFILFALLWTGNAYAQFPYSDSFKKSTVTGTFIGGIATLTAKTGVDAEGAGYLRLTDTAKAVSGFARNLSKFKSDQGIYVTFEYYTYGGKPIAQPGDGISFFLFDASVINAAPQPPTYPDSGFVIGGAGGALGYANFDGTPGLRKGYIGIGFDEYGNFATKDHSKQTGEDVTARKRENVTMRGDGDGLGTPPTNYEYLGRVVTTALPDSFTVQGKVDGRTKGAGGLTRFDPGYRKATIELLPNGLNTGYKVNVWITEGTVGGGFEHHVVNNYSYISTNAPPAELSYGFGASTGGSTNFHEIRAIEIVIPPSQKVAPVAVADSVTTAEDTPVTFSIVGNDYDANGNSTLNFASIDLDPSVVGEQKTFTNTDGTYTVNTSGVVTFTPALNFNGTAAPVPYTIKDDGTRGIVAVSESIAANIRVTVTPVNDKPAAAVPATIDVTEDTPKALTGISFTDIDAGTGQVVVTFSLPANSGSLSAASGAGVTVGGTATALSLTGKLSDINAFIGNVTYTPVLNSNTDVTLTVLIDDAGNTGSGGALTDTKTLVLHLLPVNDAPVVADLPKTGPEDVAITFTAADFTGKFTDIDGNTLTKIKIVSLPDSGTLKKGNLNIAAGDEISLADLPTITFVPKLNFNGNTSFRWNGFDGLVYAAANANVNMTITPVNDPPVVKNITKTGPEDLLIKFTAADFTGNFTDIEGNALVRIKVMSLPANGILKKGGQNIVAGDEIDLAELGNITFLPDLNFTGNTSFLWNGYDGAAYAQSHASANITITPENDPPVAVNDAATTDQGTEVIVNVVANDTDPDGNGTIDITSVDIDTTAAGIQTTFIVQGQGTYTANNNGTVTFSPLPAYESGVGTATPIYYTIKDKSGLVSNAATITIKVIVKSAPVANPDEATTAEDTPVTFSLSANDTDPNGNTTIDPGSIDLDPKVTGRQNTFTVTGEGTYTVNTAGSVTFVPAANYNSGAGTATPITYTIKDKSGLVSNAAAVTVTVTPVPDAPVAVNDAVTTDEDTRITFSVTGNDTDADGNSTIDLTSIDFDTGAGIKTVLTVPGEGTYTANTNGTVTFVPVANYNSGAGTATPVSYTIKDHTGLISNAATITVTVTPVNDLPVVANIPKSGTRGQTITFTDLDFKNKFRDTENDPLVRIKVVSLPLNGSLKLFGANVAAGQEIPAVDLEGITFVPDAAWSGVTSFPWNGYDGKAYAAVNATVIINIVSVNSAPVVSIVPKSGLGGQPVLFTALDFISRFTDADNNPMTKIKIVSLPLNGTLKLYGLNITAGQEISVGDIGGLTFVPDVGWGGITSFPWNGFDGTTYALTNANVVINLTPVNNPPVVTDVAKAGNGFQPVTFKLTDFTSKFTDPENNPLAKIKVLSLPANGTLKLKGVNVTAGQEIPATELGDLVFQSDLNWGGTTAFSWNGSDGTAYATNSANVNISILLPTDPEAKIGLAKKLVSITDGINGSYAVKFVFTLVNFGKNILENISLNDNLAQSFAGTEISVKSVTAFGNLKGNAAFNGTAITELLLPESKLMGGEEAKVELEINLRLVSVSGLFQNYAFATGVSSVTGFKVVDRSTDGLKPDPQVNGDVSPAYTTPIELNTRPTFIPGGFTPNNDGIHDYFVIQNALTKKVSLEVYNRWGNRVYSAREYKNDWSGKSTEGIFAGQDLPDGTYFYVVIVDGKERYAGSININR